MAKHPGQFHTRRLGDTRSFGCMSFGPTVEKRAPSRILLKPEFNVWDEAGSQKVGQRSGVMQAMYWSPSRQLCQQSGAKYQEGPRTAKRSK